jgi:hypothetical protein
MQLVPPCTLERSIHPARAYRHVICNLAYVRIDHANGGIIRNLNDGGMAIQAVSRLQSEQVIHLRFEFIRPRAKFELIGQVAWSNAAGQAGLRFTDIPLRTRRLLKDWVLSDLLTAATELITPGPVLKSANGEDGLVMASRPLRSIRLTAGAVEPTTRDNLPRAVPDSLPHIGFAWWPPRIGQHGLAGSVDAMVVISAVLLFSIIVVELTDVLPSWPIVASTETTLALVFALLYHYLCHFLMQRTLGTQLAEIATHDRCQPNTVSSGRNLYQHFRAGETR